MFVAWRDLANDQAGGSEVYVDRIAAGAAARGHDVALVCGGPVEPRPYDVVNSGGVYSQYLRAPFEVLRRFRDADVVVEVINGMPFFVPLWCRGPRLAVVHHVHNEQWGQFFPPLVAKVGWRLERAGIRTAHRKSLIVTVSESSVAALTGLGVPPDRIRTVENGIDPGVAVCGPAPEPLFVALGRVVVYKRLHLLLDLWARVQPVVGGRLVIAGRGPERAALEQRGVPGVEFAGFIDETEKRRLLSQAWLLVHTASHEGWGVALMEAGSFGTPSLAFDVPGVRDAVVDGKSGVLVGTPDAFVAEWIALAQNTPRREALGVGACLRASEFSWDRTIDSFLKVVEEAAAESPRRRSRRQRLGS